LWYNRTHVNFIDAAASGAAKAIPLVANIAANLIASVAILHFINATLTWFGRRAGVEKLTYEVSNSETYLFLACKLAQTISFGRKRKLLQPQQDRADFLVY